MSKTLAFGLSVSGKAGAAKPKPKPLQKPSAFGGHDDSDQEEQETGASEPQELDGDLYDDLEMARTDPAASQKRARRKPGAPAQPPKLKSQSRPAAPFGDLSSSLLSRKNAQEAAELDSTIYEYDSVYHSFNPPKTATTKEPAERKPKYMRSLLQAAEVRKRDALIAEEKKIAREREAEGEEYAGKEKFVTEAYKKQQQENRRLEEEEKRREAEEAKANKGGGMSAFYRKLLDKGEQRHGEIVKAVAERAKLGPAPDDDDDAVDDDEPCADKSEAQLAQELNEKGASVAVNEEGQVVDKRQLLRGGLNVGSRKKEEVRKQQAEHVQEADKRHVSHAQFGRKQAMRERQSRMMEEQLEQSLKRSREAQEAQRHDVERALKSRKTESDISSAKERYLARKRAAEEAKRQDKAT
ncbi:uncharacterized protein UV8b_02878 [Ustilaginoidea virens]|uniref:Nuclear speckle splicing regulatory protein 1 N-terminal domain-containing protein n=1 Tax=Ustilaginoidea virens TaxID=1159556 RepID=A0A063BM15_USTVR|nr:uncharacterized protein UV8b_02878 [Ustilaginoidea virens]QUC18637.1 hypothetical protein UV8b_02878 [Ustilaginoidea virens]GAO16929.1 hypothetical protein UVI_02046320 [Ustilaginoidea virens]